MQKEEKRDVVIIGFGLAGAFLGLNLPRLNALVTIFTGDRGTKKKSRGNYVHHGFANIPGLTQVSGRQIISKTEQAIREDSYRGNVEIIEEAVWGIKKIDEDAGGGFKVVTGSGTLATRFVVLAIGAMDRQPEIPLGSSNIKAVFPYAGTPKSPPSIHYCLRCDGHEVHDKSFAVIGSSASVPRIAELLFMRSLKRDGRPGPDWQRTGKSYVLLNGEKPLFSLESADRLRQIGVEIISSPIEKILGQTKSGRLEGFLLQNGRTVLAEQAFVCLGMRLDNPLLEVANNLGVDRNETGFIEVDPATGETSVPGLFAVGDIVAGQPKQIYAHWAQCLRVVRAIESRVWDAMRASLVS